MSLQTFFSKTNRHARSMCRHVERMLNHQRDILSPKAIEEIQTAVRELDAAASSTTDKAVLQPKISNLETAAHKWLKPYPNAAWRENIEVLLVALAVAMAVRTFFLQPFKIPTGSMQPTLYGVTSVPDFGKNFPFTTAEDTQEQLRLASSLEIPGRLQRFREWFRGTSYVHVVAAEDGVFEGAQPPFRFLIFNISQRIRYNGKTIRLWFPPDYGNSSLDRRAGLHPGQTFRKGESIVKLKVNAGDHLFVNRLSYNFRPPERGEIIVFETRGIPGIDSREQGSFYIKRLVGLGGESLRIHPDYLLDNIPNAGTVPVGRLVANDQLLTSATPHFEKLYNFEGVTDGSQRIQYEENRYYGHSALSNLGHTAPPFHVPADQLYVLGDNTMLSADSRYWGSFDKNKVIGKSFFVYWPISPRFGFGHR